MFHSPSSGTSQSFFDMIETMAAPAGYSAPAFVQTKDKNRVAQVKSLAAKVLHDPLLQMDLCDRVYELMLEDLRLQRERARNYGGLL